MDFLLDNGVYLLAILIILLMVFIASKTSFKKSKMKLPPKNWKEANHLK